MNLQITLAQQAYDYSPFTNTFQKELIIPDIELFIYCFTGVFAVSALLVSTIVFFMVKRLITDPIRKLSARIKIQDLRQGSPPSNQMISEAQKSREYHLVRAVNIKNLGPPPPLASSRVSNSIFRGSQSYQSSSFFEQLRRHNSSTQRKTTTLIELQKKRMSMDSASSEVNKSLESAEPTNPDQTAGAAGAAGDIPDLTFEHQRKGCLGAVDEMQQLEHTIKKLFVAHTMSQLQMQDRGAKKKATQLLRFSQEGSSQNRHFCETMSRGADALNECCRYSSQKKKPLKKYDFQQEPPVELLLDSGVDLLQRATVKAEKFSLQRPLVLQKQTFSFNTT